ncbi:hypothetical protein, variant [Capsaspora owczarzaki ATCC 30864]|nr:hypothetical protein, variant [Capsaspora owczarzaki ATCC 30864]
MQTTPPLAASSSAAPMDIDNMSSFGQVQRWQALNACLGVTTDLTPAAALPNTRDQRNKLMELLHGAHAAEASPSKEAQENGADILARLELTTSQEGVRDFEEVGAKLLRTMINEITSKEQIARLQDALAQAQSAAARPAPAEAAARPRAELSANQVADLEASLASAPALPVGADPIQSRFDALMRARVLKRAPCNFTPILLPNENQYQDEGILSMLKDHYKQVFTEPPGNPKRFPLGIVAGIPGIGKTRASLEYVRHAVQMTQASGHATTVVPIYVTYNSTTPFGSLDRVLGAGLSIAYRVLLSYINEDNFWNLPKVQEVAAAIGRVTLSEVLGIIAMHAMQYPPNLVQLQVAAAGSSSSSSSSSPALTTANPPRVMFVLILDEFQRALIHEGVAPEPRHPVSNKIDSPFLQSIVQAMVTCSIRSISPQTWHCTALFAGLTFVPLEELIRGSSHSLTRFPVPCLTFGQSVAYVKYYMETQRPTSWPQDFDITQDAVFQRVLMYASGHARSLEAICATLSTNAFVTYVASSNSKSLNASDAELFVKAIGSALENRVSSLNMQQIESTLVSALRCAVLVNPVVKDDSGHNLVEANSLGTIVESRLVLPMLIGYALVSRLERLYAQQAPSQPLPRHWKALKTLLDKSVPGEQYSLSLESACAAALALRLYSFALEYGSDVIRLKQLHQGARFADNSSIAHLEIPKPDPSSIELCDRGGKLGPFLPNCRLPGTVYHGMINNAAVDFYTFHEKLPDQDFQVVQAGDAKLYESTVYSKTEQATLVENSSKALNSADQDQSDASDAKSKYKLALSVFADGRVSIAPESLAENVFFVDQSNFRKYFPPLLWPMFDGLSLSLSLSL